MRIFLIAVIGLLVFACQPRPKRNIAFYVNLSGEPTTLHPLKGSSDAYTNRVAGYVIETLLTKDIDTYEWKPALATDWSVSEDKKVFTFKLRKDVKWHDGSPFTAEDVKFSYDAIFDDKYKAISMRPYYEGIEKVEIIDSHTVKFYTKTNC